MSFRPSSSALNINNQFTTLWLTGGYDVNLENSALSTHIDLIVSGGALIKKNLQVLGNIYVTSNLIVDTVLGNLSGSSVKVNTLGPLAPSTSIIVTGNLDLQTHWLLASNVSTERVFTGEIVEAEPGAGIIITGNLHGDICFADSIAVSQINEKTVGDGIGVLGNINVQNNHWITANTACHSTIFTETIIEKEVNGGISFIGNVNISIISGVTCFSNTIQVDVITEKTMNAGTTFLGNVTLVDPKWFTANRACVDAVYTSLVKEKEPGQGVMIQGFMVESINSDLNPSVDCVVKLGNVTNRWLTVNTKNITVYDDAVILGNLIVEGNFVQIDTEILIVEDNKIVINGNAIIPGRDAGICIARNQNQNESGAGDVVSSIADESGALLAATATTVTLNPPTPRPDNYYNQWWLKITSGAALDEVRKIIDYDGVTGIATVDSFMTTPSASDTYQVFSSKYTVLYWDESEDKWVFGITPHGNSNPTVIRTRFADVCVGNLVVSGILTNQTGVALIGNIATNIVTATKVYANVCGNIQAKNIEVDNFVLLGDLQVDNVVTGVITADKVYANVCGNIQAKNIEVQNFVLLSDLQVSNISASIITADKVNANVCGNVVAKNIEVENLTLLGDLQANNVIVAGMVAATKVNANVCGNIEAKNIEVQNFVLLTDLTVDNVITGIVTATKVNANVCGNIQAKNIEVDNFTLLSDLQVSNVSTNVVTANKVNANVCGNIEAKNIEVQNLVLLGDLQVSNVVTGIVTATKVNANVCGNIEAKNIEVQNFVLLTDLQVNNVMTGVVTATKVNANVCGNVQAKNIEVENLTAENLTLLSDLQVSNVSTGIVTADKVYANVCGNIEAKNIEVQNFTLIGDLTVDNVVTGIVTADKVYANVCGNIEAKNVTVDNITVDNITVDNITVDNITVDNFTLLSDLQVNNVITGVVTATKVNANVCGNIEAKNIEVQNLTLLADLQVSNVLTGIITADKVYANVCGNVDAKNVVADNVTVGNIMVDGNVTITGCFNAVTSFNITDFDQLEPSVVKYSTTQNVVMQEPTCKLYNGPSKIMSTQIIINNDVSANVVDFGFPAAGSYGFFDIFVCAKRDSTTSAMFSFRNGAAINESGTLVFVIPTKTILLQDNIALTANVSVSSTNVRTTIQGQATWDVIMKIDSLDY